MNCRLGGDPSLNSPLRSDGEGAGPKGPALLETAQASRDGSNAKLTEIPAFSMHLDFHSVLCTVTVILTVIRFVHCHRNSGLRRGDDLMVD